MLNFLRTQFPHFLITVLTVSGMLGCESDVEEKEHQASSFLVDPIVAEDSQRYSNGVQGNWAEIKGSNHVTLKACLEDKAIEKYPVRSQKFEIKTPLYNDVRKTDHQGCLTWTEIINFNYLSPESIYHYPVTIKGVGDYRGAKTLELALNPWKGKSEVVKDLREVEQVRLDQSFSKKALQGTFQMNKSSNDGKAPLLFKNVNFSLQNSTFNDESRSQELIFQQSIRPVLQRELLSGEMKEIQVSKGRLELSYKLYEQFSGTDQVRLVSQKTTQKNFSTNQLEGRLEMNISSGVQVQKSSSLIMLVSAKAQGLMNELPAAHGAVYFQSARKNASASFERLQSEEEFFNKNQVLKDGLSHGIETAEDFQGLEKKWFHALGVDNTESSSLIISDINISKGDHNGREYYRSPNKEMISEANICLEDLFTQDQVANTDFEVNVVALNENYESVEVETLEQGSIPVEPNGCLNVQIPMDYNLYEASYWRPLKIQLKPLNGRHSGAKIERLIAINPFNENKFAIDAKTENLPEGAIDIAMAQEGSHENSEFQPKVFFNKVKYVNEGKKYDKVVLNKYLQLGFNKQLQLEFDPKLKRSYGHNSRGKLSPITFGEFEIEVAIYTPKRTQVDYRNIDYNDWNIISATKKKVSVKENGKINTMLDLPMMVGDSLNLTFKNLIVINIKPLDEKTKKYLEPHTAAAPFFGIHQGAEVYAEDLSQNPENREEALSFIESVTNEGLNGIMISKDNPRFSDISAPAPIDIFRNQFKKSALERDPEAKVFMDSVSDYNAMAVERDRHKNRYNNQRRTLIKNIAYDRLRDERDYPGNEISSDEFKQLIADESILPSANLLAKFCDYFFKLPKVVHTRAYPYTQLRKGEKYQKCVKSPHAVLNTRPMYHIDEIIPYEIRKKDGDILKETDGKFVGGESGSINHGNAYMIADGYRESQTSGTRESTRFFIDGFLGFSPMKAFAPGVRGGVGYEYAMFKNREEGRTLWSFDRRFVRRDIKFEFEYVDLEFRARLKRCVTITTNDQSAMGDRLHICKDNSETKTLQERWYFIGRQDVRQMGVLDDGSRNIESNQNQIIRGKSNYKALWGDETDKQAKVAILEVKESRMGKYSSFIRNKNLDPYKFEKFIDNAFPGVYVPRKNDTVDRNVQAAETRDKEEEDSGFFDWW